MSGPTVVLLGPQRYQRTVRDVASELFPEGPVATVTAGWQEWEVEDQALDADLGGRSINLNLYERARAAFNEDPELRQGHRTLGERIRLLQRAYRRRVDHAYSAWRAVDGLDGDPRVLAPERDAAFQAIRALDDEHLARVRELRAEFESGFQPGSRSSLERHRHEITRVVGGAAGVVIEGGHVPVLLNRLRLFGLGPLLGATRVVACAGGAMALASRVVFFHDAPPQGFTRPEVGDEGLGLFPGLVPLPDARQRLHLGDRDRVARFARRFAPDSCVTLEGGSRVAWKEQGWTSSGTDLLTEGGDVRSWAVST